MFESSKVKNAVIFRRDDDDKWKVVDILSLKEF